MKIQKSLVAFALIPLIMTLITHANDSNPSKNPQNKGKNATMKLQTTHGAITLELFTDKAPVTAQNFIDYVDSGFYDNTVFHRVIPGFVIQGGGLTENMRPKQTRPPIVNESNNGLKNKRGTLSMARTSDPDSATSQFFINLRDNVSLDAAPGRPGYAVFAKVVDGMDVVDKIAAVKTGSRGMHDDVPAQPVFIEKAQRIEENK